MTQNFTTTCPVGAEDRWMGRQTDRWPATHVHTHKGKAESFSVNFVNGPEKGYIPQKLSVNRQHITPF